MLITESWGLSRRASSPMATETVSDIVWSPSFLAVLRIRKKRVRDVGVLVSSFSSRLMPEMALNLRWPESPDYEH